MGGHRLVFEKAGLPMPVLRRTFGMMILKPADAPEKLAGLAHGKADVSEIRWIIPPIQLSCRRLEQFPGRLGVRAAIN